MIICGILKSKELFSFNLNIWQISHIAISDFEKIPKMWELIQPDHQGALTALVIREPKDLVLVSEDGGRVATHSLLLALHSPFVAKMLPDTGLKTAISLPFPLASISALASMLQGRQEGRDVVEGSKEVAACLGISLKTISSSSVKLEVQSGEEGEVEDDWEAKDEFVKEEAMEKHPAVQKKKLKAPTKKKRSYVESSSGESSDQDEDDDPDYMDTADNATKPIENNVPASSFKSKRYRGEFGCEHCKLRFKKHWFMMKHRLNTHNIPMDCESCDKKFSLLTDFKKHTKKEHPNKTCDECGMKFSRIQSLKNHVLAKHKEDIPCPHCGVMYATKYTLASHLGRAHGEYEMKKCSECEWTGVAADLRVHFRRKHTEDLQETCEFCGEVFKNLKKHLERTGCGQENFVKEKIPCPHCAKTFSLDTHLKMHIKNIHNSVKDKMCPHCSYSTYSNYNLRLHVSKMHLGANLVKQPCPHCDKETTNVEYHIKIYHAGKTAVNSLAIQ